MKEYKLRINNNSYNVVIKDVTDEAVLAEVNGKKHIVHIDTIENLTAIADPLEAGSISTAPSAAPAAAPKTSATPPSANAGTIVTPIPGQIISLTVSLGEQVRTGQKLLVIEAMKLENSITATIDGAVSEILVAEGDVVTQGQPLIVLT